MVRSNLLNYSEFEMKEAVLVLLIISSCQAGVVPRKNGEQQETKSSMEFFSEFNDLFGMDWWRALDETKPVETNKIEYSEKVKKVDHDQSSRSSQVHQDKKPGVHRKQVGLKEESLPYPATAQHGTLSPIGERTVKLNLNKHEDQLVQHTLPAFSEDAHMEKVVHHADHIHVIPANAYKEQDVHLDHLPAVAAVTHNDKDVYHSNHHPNVAAPTVPVVTRKEQDVHLNHLPTVPEDAHKEPSVHQAKHLLAVAAVTHNDQDVHHSNHNNVAALPAVASDTHNERDVHQSNHHPHVAADAQKGQIIQQANPLPAAVRVNDHKEQDDHQENHLRANIADDLKKQHIHQTDLLPIHTMDDLEKSSKSVVTSVQEEPSPQQSAVPNRHSAIPTQHTWPNQYPGYNAYQQPPFYNYPPYYSPYQAMPHSYYPGQIPIHGDSEASAKPATPHFLHNPSHFFYQPHHGQGFYPQPYYFPPQHIDGVSDVNPDSSTHQDGQGTNEEDAPPTARSYGEGERNNILSSGDIVQSKMHQVPNFPVPVPPHPHPFFYHPLPLKPRHISNHFLDDSLDDFMSRPPSGPLITSRPSLPSELNYRSLLKPRELMQPDEPLDILEAEDDILVPSDDNIPELDEADICQTPDGKFGTCVSPNECSSVSGMSASPCSDSSVTGDLTCCVHTVQCEEQSPNQVTYIQNPSTTSLSSCPVSVALLPSVCQVRMDFIRMTFLPPVESKCNSSNAITFTTSPGGVLFYNSLCGTISDGSYGPLSPNIPHLYTHFDPKIDPFPYPTHSLNLQMSVSQYPSSWNIRVVQIPCDDDSPLMADRTCSQWYTGSEGNMTSLGLVNMDTEIKVCIKPDPTACAVKYVIHSMECANEDQVQILGSDKLVCGVEEKVVVLPAGMEMGLSVSQGVASYRVEYSLLQECDVLNLNRKWLNY